MATKEEKVASRESGSGIGISLGGIIIIVGIVLMFVWSFWIGLIIAVIGLVAFGGFARGKWY
jgi:FtsH-binding integral membrane protein